jgi:hypothetical protein
MRISTPILSALAAGAGLVGRPTVTRAATEPTTINTPPSTPGAERTGARVPRERGFAPGWEAGGGVGTGFAGTYAFGVEGRVGYTLPLGVYVGGNAQAYWGNSAGDQTAHATFLGGEVGYKYFVRTPLEVRPYVFLGPAFITQVSDNPPTANSHTGFAVQPGLLGLYHAGNVFLGGDFRFMTTPGPVSVALMGSGGGNF